MQEQLDVTGMDVGRLKTLVRQKGINNEVGGLGGGRCGRAQQGGMGERCKLSHRGSGAEIQKLCKLCIINALNHKKFQGIIYFLKIA